MKSLGNWPFIVMTKDKKCGGGAWNARFSSRRR